MQYLWTVFLQLLQYCSAIFYRIDVFPDNGAAYVPPTPANSEPESIVVDTPAETPAEAPAETPAEAPAEAANTETGNDGETVIFTYDMTQLDDEDE